jgi:hypothetical protein
VVGIRSMRSYIFTASERKAILRFAKDRKRSPTINKIVFLMEKDWRTLLADYKLLIILRRLVDDGY